MFTLRGTRQQADRRAVAYGLPRRPITARALPQCGLMTRAGPAARSAPLQPQVRMAKSTWHGTIMSQTRLGLIAPLTAAKTGIFRAPFPPKAFRSILVFQRNRSAEH